MNQIDLTVDEVRRHDENAFDIQCEMLMIQQLPLPWNRYSLARMLHRHQLVLS